MRQQEQWRDERESKTRMDEKKRRCRGRRGRGKEKEARKGIGLNKGRDAVGEQRTKERNKKKKRT